MGWRNHIALKQICKGTWGLPNHSVHQHSPSTHICSREWYTCYKKYVHMEVYIVQVAKTKHPWYHTTIIIDHETANIFLGTWDWKRKSYKIKKLEEYQLFILVFRSWCCTCLFPVQHYACQQYCLGNPGLLLLSRGRFVSWCTVKSLPMEAQSTSSHPVPGAHLQQCMCVRGSLNNVHLSVTVKASDYRVYPESQGVLTWCCKTCTKKASPGLPGQLVWL